MWINYHILIIIVFDYFFIFSSDGTESPNLAETETIDGLNDKPRIKYGELVILG